MSSFLPYRAVLLLLLGSTSFAYEYRSLLYPRRVVSFGLYQAAFGDSVRSTVSFDLLRPPNEAFRAMDELCELPASINNSTSYTHTYHDEIGLVVPRASIEGCSPGQQAKIAIEIQKRIPAVKYLILHETSMGSGSRGETLRLTPEEEEEGFDYSSIGVFYLPYSDFVPMAHFMAEYMAISENASWFLLDPNSLAWHFRVKIPGTYGISQGPENLGAFYWLRFFLFTLLIVTPCFRAVYLWYSGGGRLHWRRNENGRITGILYVPPMPVWLWATRHNAPEPISDKLTEEQFRELPMILFQKEGKKYDEDDSSQGDVTGYCKGDVDLEIQDTLDTLDSSMNSSMGDGAFPDPSELVDDGDSPNAEVKDSVATSSAENPHPISSETTTCTMCSICIDDFENGESLILLPRCKHAFHEDCIHPWLLERQGCCPMCKVGVREVEGEADEPESSAQSAEPDLEATSTQNPEPDIEASRSDDSEQRRLDANSRITDEEASSVPFSI